MKNNLQYALIAVMLFLMIPLSFGQAPNLGSASKFAVFTASGLFKNVGPTAIKGDIGTHAGAFSGFPPGVVNGQIHIADGVSAQAAADVGIAYGSISSLACGQVIGVGLGNAQMLTPNIYCTGAASTLNGALILDGQGNPNAVFIFKIGGALATGTFSSVTLINGASFCNVYWQVNGAVSLGTSSVFRGTLLVNGAISLANGASLFGRALSTAGAISLDNNTVTNGIPIPAVITASGAVTFCFGGSVTLSGNIDGVWNTGETTPSITVTTSGDYFVTNTDECGVVTSNHIIVTVNPLPNCSISGNGSICAGQSTQLCVAAGFTSYLWSTGATTNCITVNATGNYAVTITDANGCMSSCSKTVTVNPLPICSITGNSPICQGQSTQLCVPAGSASYMWSTGANTNCITVNASGTYFVTITDANGCMSNCSKTVVVNPIPDCTISGNGSICQGQSTQLCAPAGVASYLWSTGATTNCITVNQTGNYSVTVTNSNGCSSICSKTVTVNPTPLCSITGNGSICAGQSTQLCVPAGSSSYLWSTGATTNCITVNASGTYSVTVTEGIGCTSVCSKTVVVNPLPNCLITGNGSICQGQSTQLCVPAGSASYLWSTGATTNCITVNATGNYAVTVTDANGCSSICSKTVTVNPLPLCSIMGNSPICQGQSTQLCVPAGSASYLWSTGATTNCITVSVTGNYSVTITDANGCSSNCSKQVTVNPLPDCTITGSGAICTGQSTQLCVPAGAASYLWSTGATTNCITVNQTGNYSVTVTNSNGCSSICNKQVIVSQQPTCLITGNGSICPGQSTQLCVPAGSAAYMWSTGATTNCITVNQAGTYSVTVTEGAGCTSVCSKTVTVDQQPTCLITGNGSICQGQSTQLCVPAGSASYLWSTGATTNCITVNQAGTYSVTVTEGAGCTSICSKIVTVNPLPDCTISGNGSLCTGQSTQLCVAAGAASYIWSTGSTSNCITVNLAGTYSVTVTNSSGCMSICSKIVTVEQQPTCIITGNGSLCTGQSTQLCVPASATATYMWSTGATTNCITVNQAGTYSVTVTEGVGCTSVCSKTVTVGQQPTCLITGNGALCTGQSTQLCVPASGTATYLWSTGATTNCITVNQAGTYSVTVTEGVGCSSVCSKTVTVGQQPTCIITGNGSLCTGQSTQLCVPASGTATYMWSTGATTNCITVTQAGTYSVTVTEGIGCTSVCSKTVTVGQQPTCLITGNGSLCTGQSTQLCVPASGTATYLWSTGATTNCITVNQAGTYSVTVTEGVGCTSVCSKTVTVGQQPTCIITGNGALCTGQSTQLCVPASATATYLWSTGATTNCITVNQAGTYSVTVTEGVGCSSVCSKTVTVGQQPTCIITGNGSLCTGQSTQLCVPASGTATYMWSTGATTNCITVTQAGTYSVTVTEGIGCTSVCSKTVTVGQQPTCLITGNGSLCTGQSTQLCVPASATATYLWITGATTNCITVNQAGTYSVTVTEGLGCSSVCSKTVTVGQQPDCLITGNGILCTGQSTQLCVPASATATYLWSTGATTNCITVSQAGTYSVTVTEGVGCSSVCSKTVTVGPAPNCKITLNGSICEIGSTQLCVPSGAVQYLWSTGAKTNCITVTALGTYSVTVTGVGGCNSFCSVNLRDSFCIPLVDAGRIGGDEDFCPGSQLSPILETVQPSGGRGNLEYMWMYSTSTSVFDANTWLMLPGETGPDLINIPALTRSAYFIRCVRRECCDVFKESNVILKHISAYAEIKAPYTACVGQEITFTATDIGPSAVYFWYFDNASSYSLSGRSVKVKFTSAGIQRIFIEVYNLGCMRMTNQTIEVKVCSPGGGLIQSSNPSAQNAKQYKAYPNPFDDQLFVELLQFEEQTKWTVVKGNGALEEGIIEVYNAQGSLMKTQRFTKEETRYEINTSQLPSGSFFIKVIPINGEIKTIKVNKF